MASWRKVGKEVTSALLIALVIAVIAAALPWLNGRDIAFSVFRAREAEREPDPAVLEAIRVELDLPDTPLEGIVSWLGGVFTGDFGVSWVDPSRSALDAAWSGLPNSLALAFTSIVAAALLGWVLAAPRIFQVARGKSASSVSVLVASLIGGIPLFVSASSLLIIFGLYLDVLPISGLDSPRHFILPVTALALHAGGMLGRILIIAADSLRQEQWLESWRINGVSLWSRHIAIIQRCLITMTPQLALMLASSVPSTVLIEATFNIPGFGNAALDAARNQDIPVLQVVLLTTVVIGVVMGLLARLINYFLTRPMAQTDNSYSSHTGSHRRGSTRLDWIVFILALIPLVIISTGIVLPNPTVDVTHRLAEPSAQHWIGADQLGRDLFARLANGAPYTIGVALLVTAVNGLLGLLLGLTGTWSQRVGNVLNALPEVFIGLILAGLFGGSMVTAALAIVIAGWVPIAAHVSAVATETRHTGYVHWAQNQGATRWWIMVNHIIPASVSAAVRHSASRVAGAALALASLGYLGIGAEHDSPEWGVVLAEAIPYAERAPWLVIFPTLLLMSLGATSALGSDLRLRPKTPKR